MPQTCWSNKTPFQMGLILTLMVALPYLVVMIFIYLSFIFGSYESESCLRLCHNISSEYEERQNKPKKWANEDDMKERWVVGPENFSEIVKKDLKIVEENLPAVAKRAVTNEKLKTPQRINEYTKKTLKADSNQHYFPVAALLEKLYYDKSDEELFKCTIAKLSSNWALTTTNCFKYEVYKWNLLSIRSNSYYWSKGGNINKIENVFSYKNLVALKLKSDQPSAQFYISNFSNISNNKQTFYWVVNLQLPLQKRLKFGKLQITNLPSKETHDMPIFNFNQNLIGFQSCKFTYENLSEYRSWLDKLNVF
ncbi:uncharacterized protein LOC123011342 [Tribolium madens]|uniref:uncharacterized protein LOC123011342 n=1 Tax=Tribolium madens TaxID=41895 RepID=UPI001CF741E2|nr:uncharacterized protein LOC123011342 [Tribolium madens]